MANPVIIEKDMAYNRKDMLTGIRRAFGDAMSVVGNTVTVTLDTGKLSVSLGPELERKIALMRIIHMNVTLSFEGFADGAREETLVQFDRAFQRGGG